jgi:glucose/arabinose dehydrogenase
MPVWTVASVKLGRLSPTKICVLSVIATLIVVTLVLSKTAEGHRYLADLKSGYAKAKDFNRRMDQAPFVPKVVATGLNIVWDIEFVDDHRALIAERTGIVRLFRDGVLQPAPYYRFNSVLVNDKTEHTGLYDLEPSPNYRNNHWIYALYSVSSATDTPFSDEAYGRESDHWHPIVRLSRLTDTGTELINEKVLLETDAAILTKSAGARMRFGPDGRLYVTTPFCGMLTKPQDKMSLLGKTLRLDEDGKAPQDNPFVGQPGARPEIWSFGHKDAYGIDFRKGDGLQLQAENGPSGDQFFRAHGYDEVNVIRKGANYGFPDSYGPWVQPGTVAPIWNSGDRPQSPGAARFLNSPEYGPGLQGRLLVSSMSAQNLRAFDIGPAGDVRSVAYLIQNPSLNQTEAISALWAGDRSFGRIRAIGIDSKGIIFLGTTNTKSVSEPKDEIIELVPRK